MGLHIMHVDMDAFFAAIEIRDRPELRGKPVIIGGEDPQARGVVSTASYEARRYGVVSAMPLVQAYERCPHGVFIQGDMKKYEGVSREMFQIFSRYTPLLEPVSLDEGFLDLEGCEGLFGSPRNIGNKIKEEIKEKLRLTASVGLAPNKFLAKLASDMEKPDGFVVIEQEQVQDILKHLPVEKLWGVGKKTASLLREQGLETVGKLAKMEPQLLEAKLGKHGTVLWQLAQGIDHRPVIPMRKVQSVGREHTFARDISDIAELETALCYLCEEVGRRLRLQGLMGRTVTLKLRYSDFKTVTKRRTVHRSTSISWHLFRYGKEILRTLPLEGRGFRLLGISVSALQEIGEQQGSLFQRDQELRDEQIASTIHALKNRYGNTIITPARLLEWKG